MARLNRNVRIAVRVSPGERKVIEAAAAEKDMNLSEFIRYTISRYLKEVK